MAEPPRSSALRAGNARFGSAKSRGGTVAAVNHRCAYISIDAVHIARVKGTPPWPLASGASETLPPGTRGSRARALPSLVAVPPLPVFRLGLSAGICRREPLLCSDASRCPVAKALSAGSEA